jgi:hypothetical protein
MHDALPIARDRVMHCERGGAEQALEMRQAKLVAFGEGIVEEAVDGAQPFAPDHDVTPLLVALCGFREQRI